MAKAAHKAITHIPAPVTHGRLTPTSYEYIGDDVKVTLTDDNGGTVAYTMRFSDIVRSVTMATALFNSNAAKAVRLAR